jgi:hypothetical protein
MIDVTATASERQVPTAEWEIVDLLLSDEQLVNEMFEDIVTAAWPPTPTAPPTNPPGARGGTVGAEKPEPPAGTAGPIPRHRVHHPGTEGRVRERSPPTPTAPVIVRPPGIPGGDALT